MKKFKLALVLGLAFSSIAFAPSIVAADGVEKAPQTTEKAPQDESIYS